MTHMLWIEEPAGRSWAVPPGGIATGFVEGCTYTFRVDVPHTIVLVDDIPLDRPTGPQAWVWAPGFYAGRVDVEVLDDAGRPIASYSLDVGPSPDKLGEPQFLQMVSEILALMPTLLLGDGATRSQFGRDGDMSSVEIAYARLRHYGGACIAALRIVCQHPLTRLEQQRRAVQPYQVRRLDIRTVRELSRTPAVSQLLQADHDDAANLSQVTVPHVEATFDHAANRTLAVMLDRLLARVAELGNRFASVTGESHERLSSRIPRRLRLLIALDAELRDIRRSPVFQAVRRPEVSAAGLNAVAAQPDYAQAFRYAWKALNMGVLGHDDDEPLPTGPTWQIYERWCFMRVWQLLQEIAPKAGWRLVADLSGHSLPRVQGYVNNHNVVLHLQPTFHTWDFSNPRGFRSLSRQREPDLVLTVQSAQSRRFLVLDAKYRVSRSNVLDAMQSAHIYQDSLTWGNERPWGSFLLLPRGGAVGWLADDVFQNTFRVGTFELAPDSDASGITACLKHFLQG